MAEEYDLRTTELIGQLASLNCRGKTSSNLVRTLLVSVRKWKAKGRLGGVGGWEFEVGEPPIAASPVGDGLMESSNNVRVLKSVQSYLFYQQFHKFSAAVLSKRH